ncbi:hypothetical protein UM93_01270 [Psychromicrobium lacuslunae]|uniref:Uncharacterized protein n=1 Tax=Psychromicrobium lacuslunae TaxID=1618207 RepID=A0A0D4BWM4_9MICC|nr:hypothetical protein UM93_01270 [Psychromicrobium lacuslunae]
MRTFQGWFKNQTRRSALSQGNAGFPLGAHTPADRDNLRISHELQALQQHRSTPTNAKDRK